MGVTTQLVGGGIAVVVVALLWLFRKQIAMLLTAVFMLILGLGVKNMHDFVLMTVGLNPGPATSPEHMPVGNDSEQRAVPVLRRVRRAISRFLDTWRGT